MANKRRLIFILVWLIYTPLLYFFYLKYVPLIIPFQTVLLPILVIIFILTAINLERGSLFFIFVFPLINSLPYCFGIFEHTPHAPTALVLFLFFFWGYLSHFILFGSDFSFKTQLAKPLFLFSILIIISAAITCFRYTNFFPFLTPHIYELITNVHGVTAGGAIMSSLFFALNYLSGFAFFFLLFNIIQSKEYMKKIFIILLLSTGLSLAVGLYQHFFNISFGNTPLRINESLINATFKDPLSLGAFLSLILPVILSMALASPGWLRIMASALFLIGLFILPQTGSKSGLIGTLISLFLWLLFSGLLIWRHKIKSISTKKTAILGGLILLIAALSLSWFFISKGSETYKRLTDFNYKYGGLAEAVNIRLLSQWKMAAYMIRDFPLTGVGVGAYMVELPNYVQMHKGFYREWVDSAENYFLQAGAEMGLLALLLSIWIFWKILKQIKKALMENWADPRWALIQIGLACGLLSILLNFQVHTYIGSYEIKYIFWLAVACLFSWEEKDKKLTSRLFKPRLKILISIIIIIFAGLSLWHSTHSLSLASRTAKLGLRQNFGLYQLEQTPDGRKFRWTKSYGGLTFKVIRPVVTIPIMASHPDIRKKPVKVRIYLVKDLFKQKKILTDIILKEPNWRVYRINLSQELRQQVTLLFQVSRTWNPKKILGTPDSRNLGIALGTIRFKNGNKKSFNQFYHYHRLVGEHLHSHDTQ